MERHMDRTTVLPPLSTTQTVQRARINLATRGRINAFGGIMTPEKIDLVTRTTEAGFFVVTTAANELASVAVFDAMQTLRRNYFHGCKEVRKWASQCQRQIDGYEVRMKMEMKEASRRLGLSGNGRDKYTLWLDLTDHVDEEMKPHMERFFYAIKMVMDKHHQPHSETLARMWTARFMLSLATETFNKIFEAQRKDCFGIVSLRREFSYGCMDGQLKCWDIALKAMDKHLCPKDGKHVALEEDTNVNNGMMAIINKLNDFDIYERGAEYSIKLNADVVDAYNAIESDEQSK